VPAGVGAGHRDLSIGVGPVALVAVPSGEAVEVIRSRSSLKSALSGYRFPRKVIAVAVRGYLRYGLSYRDVEELLAERGIAVDHVTIGGF
jgi:hypothetical protein